MSDIDSKDIINVLLVEDNPGDIRLVQEVMKGKDIFNLHVARDGEEAIAFFSQHSKLEEGKQISLIILDLNLPRKDGREVLAEIKQDPALRQIPVIVLTTSTAQADILKSYELRANCYITKPVGFKEFVRVIRTVEEFWLNIARLPLHSVNRT